MAKVSITSMNNWSTKMNTLNEAADGLLDSINENLKELENYWSGDAENAAINATFALTSKAKEYHNNMTKVSNFLIETANTMSNQ